MYINFNVSFCGVGVCLIFQICQSFLCNVVCVTYSLDLTCLQTKGKARYIFHLPVHMHGVGILYTGDLLHMAFHSVLLYGVVFFSPAMEYHCASLFR